MTTLIHTVLNEPEAREPTALFPLTLDRRRDRASIPASFIELTGHGHHGRPARMSAGQDRGGRGSRAVRPARADRPVPAGAPAGPGQLPGLAGT